MCQLYLDIFPDIFASNKRGMYCDCEEQKSINYTGFTGVHCDIPYTVCNDTSVCLNNSTCTKIETNMRSPFPPQFGCKCPRGYGGAICEFKLNVPVPRMPTEEEIKEKERKELLEYIYFMLAWCAAVSLLKFQSYKEYKRYMG